MGFGKWQKVKVAAEVEMEEDAASVQQNVKQKGKKCHV